MTAPLALAIDRLAPAFEAAARAEGATGALTLTSVTLNHVADGDLATAEIAARVVRRTRGVIFIEGTLRDASGPLVTAQALLAVEAKAN